MLGILDDYTPATAMARVNYYCRSPGGVQAAPRHALRVAGVSSHLHDGGDEREPRAPFLFLRFFSSFYSTLSLVFFGLCLSQVGFMGESCWVHA